MWGAEHTAMALIFGCFALWLWRGDNLSWLWAAALSQVPFWGGSVAYWLTGDATPVEINLALNLIMAGLFIDHADRLRKSDRGGIVHVWLCLIFVLAGTFDVLQFAHPFSLYMLAQEFIHYIALIAIGGRAYVRHFDGDYRWRHRDLQNSNAGGDLV